MQNDAMADIAAELLRNIAEMSIGQSAYELVASTRAAGLSKVSMAHACRLRAKRQWVILWPWIWWYRRRVRRLILIATSHMEAAKGFQAVALLSAKASDMAVGM